MKEKIKKLLKNKYLRILLIVTIFSLVVISRRVDVITYPQFYAEDGVFWFSEAYNNTNNPWEPFFVPKQGYFQTISRVGGYLGNSFPINYAPLVFNIFAILFQILPAIYFLSARFNKIISSFYLRFACSLAYLLLLGTAETHANLTNVQWRLALLMFLIIIVPKSKNSWWRIFDGTMLFLAGLSGPFVFFAFPLALFYFYQKKTIKHSLDRLTILFLTFLVQLYSYFFIVSDAVRSKQELGANFVNFFKIIAGNIFLRGILGPDYVKKIRGFRVWENGYLPVLLGIFLILILLYTFWKSELEIKLFIVFAVLIFLAALSSPQVSLDKPQWEVMAVGSGGRYYFFPIMAYIFSLGWLVFNSKIKFLKFLAGFLLCCFILVGLPKDWVFAKYKNYHFNEQIKEFNKINSGENFTFKIVPKWDMTLKKK